MDSQILEELAAIKAQLKVLIEEHPQCRKQIYEIGERVAKVEQSSKSAHHRIDEFRKDVCWTLGLSVTLVGGFATIITNFLR